MDAYQHIKGFMTADELERFNELIESKSDWFVETSGRGGLGPRYRVIDGITIRSHLPEIESYG